MKKILFLFPFFIFGCDKLAPTHQFTTETTETEKNGKPVVTVIVTCSNGSSKASVTLKTRDDVKRYKHQIETVLQSLENAEKLMIQNEQE